MADHRSCCGGSHDVPGRKARRSTTDEPVIGPAGPISTTIVDYAARVRFRLPEDAVERRAQQLHARNSYDCWNGLSEKDQELWRHMARMDLAG
ncbi:hypothetical protein [Modestobacter sp. SYSU DS0290]